MSGDYEQARERYLSATTQNTQNQSHELLNISILADDRAINDGGPGIAEDRSWTERHTVRHQYLSIPEAASLIVNKMIGTGIFTTPGLVLYLTQNKSLALSFWIIGGLYAAMCLLLYLDYGTGLPFNGAELIYLTRVYHTIRFKMLPPILFASFFVCLYHTAGNSISFARYVIIAGSSPDADGQYHPNDHLVKAFAICILAVVCFLLWVSPRSGLILSKTIAAYKILLVLTLGFWGISYRHKNNSENYYPTRDWGYQTGAQPRHPIQRLSAFIYVAYSYNGWENACYVLGQLDKSDSRWRTKVRWGAVVAVVLVSIGYTVLTIGYYISCTYEEINSNVIEASDLGIARVFSARVLGTTQGLTVTIALSAFGNLLAVAYTQTKVKQAIALHHFLPFSTFFASDEPFNTPGGALLLHWSMSTIFILATPSNSDGYAFIIGLVTYGQLIMVSFVGIGRFKLQDAITRAKLETQGWRPWIHSTAVNSIAGFVLAGVNIVLLVAAAWPIADEKRTIQRWLWPVVLAGCLSCGFLYWLVLQGLQRGLGRALGWEWRIKSTQAENELDQYRRLTRRDGTEERYEHSVSPDGVAAAVVRGRKKLGKLLEEYL